MWILFSILCMAAFAAAEITGKKIVGNDEHAPIKLRILVLAASFLVGTLMYVFGLGESGLAPWQLLKQYPLILLGMVFTATSDFLYLYSFKYVGLTIAEAISSLEGIGIFVGMLAINVTTGGLTAVRDMLVPARMIPICIVMIAAIILPNIENLANRNSVTELNGNAKRNMIIGMVIALFAVAFGSMDSLVNDAVLDTGKIGAADFMMAAMFSEIILIPVFGIALLVKSKDVKSEKSVINRYSLLYTVFFIAQGIFGVLAASIDAVRSEVMYLAYPVIAIVAAKIVLKEKYTWRQNICIWVITIAAIAFCVIDYII